MAPLLPRFHLFEIDDQTWFPPAIRAKFQAALTLAWTFEIAKGTSAASAVAQVLADQLAGSSPARLRDYVFVDFCAGGGGPTPSIERHLNQAILGGGAANGSSSGSSSGRSTTAATTGGRWSAEKRGGSGGGPAAVSDGSEEPVRFILTDLHPHVEDWAKAAAQSPNISYVSEPVDAADAPADLVMGRQGGRAGKKVFRLFNLAFHHFDDPLARTILSNTATASDGFGIFELQERSLLGLLAICALGIGIMLLAPYYAIKRRSPMTLFLTWVVPILPFVLVFDGWISALRTRTPEEVEALLRSCGAEGTERWQVRSGKKTFLGLGHVNWIICEPSAT